MVSASTSVNAGVGPRLRRRVSPRICRTASSITQYSQTKRSSRSMDGPPQGSGALKNVPHRPIPRGRLFEVTHSASLNRGKPEVRVEMITRERWAPVGEHTHESSFRDKVRCLLLEYARQAEPLYRRP